MKPIKWLVFVTISIFLFLGVYLACSGTSDPAAPPEETGGKVQAPSQRTVQGGNLMVWGFYDVAIYPEQDRVDITPNRTAWLTLNVSPYLHGPESEMMFIEIDILDYSDLGYTGDCKIGVTLTHPYPDLPEFCGFDVMGLFMTDGSGQGVQDLNLTYPLPGQDPMLLNSDGYTRWMNPTEFPGKAPWGFFDPLSDENSGFIANSTLSAYRYFADGIEPEETVKDYYSDAGNCAQRGLFSYGGQCTRNYELRFPMVGGEPQILFNYAIVASWNLPLPTPPQHIPDDFPVNANASFPIHAAITNYSTLYYLDSSDYGGEIIFEVEVFDWSNFFETGTLKQKISRVVVESRDNLIKGNHWEASNTEIMFQPGNTLNSSRCLITIPCKPTQAGMVDLLVAIEVDSESGYNQGYGEEVPVGELAIYLRPFIEVAECPGAMIGNISKFQVSSGETALVLNMFGSGFISGSQLSVKLVDPITETVIDGYDTTFVDSGEITTNFNFNGIEPGVFNIVCTNGCGTESSPPNILPWWDGKFKVVGTIPNGVTASTGRSGPYAETVDSLELTWPHVLYAQAYRIYIDADPASATGKAGCFDELYLLAETTENFYSHNAYSTTPFDNHSSYAYVVRSYYDIGTGSGESENSNIVFYSGQDFDGADWGEWGYVKQNESNINWTFLQNGYSGEGFYFEADVISIGYPAWLMLYSPKIPFLPSATKVKFEFNHRFDHFFSQDGYFIGFTTANLPAPYQGNVSGVHPIPEVSYGAGYTDGQSVVLQQEYNLSSYYIQNYSSPGSGWWGWYLSGFDVSDALSFETDFRAVIAMAFYDANIHRFNLDDCALLVY